MIATLFSMLFLFNAQAISLSGHVVQDFSQNMKKEHGPGVFVKLLSWQDQSSEKCLVYKTPLRSKLGSLYLIPSSDCQLSTLKKQHLYQENIRTLSFVKEETSYILTFNDKRVVLGFPISVGLPYLKSLETKGETLKSGVLCRVSGPQCEGWKINKCKTCDRAVWTPFLNWKCGKSSERVCGVIPCGLKNQQACLKGLSQSEDLLDCEQAKALTFCRKGLQIICEGDGRVICR